MWLKNLLLYRINFEIPPDTESLERSLAAYAFLPCSAHDQRAIGWVSPFGNEQAPLVHAANSNLLLTVRQEEKLLPAAVIKQALQQRLDQWQEATGGRLTQTKKQALREQIISQLLPRAFSRFQEIRIWIDSRNALLAVDTPSFHKAETTLALLRQSLGTLSVIPWIQSPSITPLLTQWVATQALPEGFQLQEEAELRSMQAGGGVIRCKQQPLDSDEIAGHLAANKQVTQLALNWKQQIQFILTEDGRFKRLKYADSLQTADEIAADDRQQRLDADFVLATAALSELLQALKPLLSSTAHPIENSPTASAH
ncbi:MAG: recombination-associated protein RdgC [Candidatus Symbiodolus clandestinus]